jgi:hypothetical protein
MKIAVLDSGIDLSHKQIIKEKIYIIPENLNDNWGHGTAIVGIIQKHAPETEIIPIKIFTDNLICKESVLCSALEKAINFKTDIINLSLGICTKFPSKPLYELCCEAYNNNIIIVAASYHNINNECYPAYFQNTFGVGAAKTKLKSDYGFINNSPIEFLARGSIQRVAWKNGGYNIVTGSSYACAHFTGIVSNCASKSEYTDIGDIRNLLIKNANKNILPLLQEFKADNYNVPTIQSKYLDEEGYSIFNSKNKLKWINNISIFPASEKEMKSLLEFSTKVVFPISFFIDYPRNVKKEKNKKKSSLVILDGVLNNEFQEFETLVAGYFNENLFEINRNYGWELMNQCITKNKNLFLFDLTVYEELKKKNFKNYKGNIYIPCINTDIYEKVLLYRTLEKVKVPVIAVIGTSNKQGKFTTQLKLKEILSCEGYKVSHLSTEPQGELLGAENSFPYGYSSLVQIKRELWAFYIRSLLKGIQEFNKPHIIITGIQGGTILRSPTISNPLGNETASLDFLFGVQPDAVVCAINPNDTIDIIKQNIETAKVYTNAKVLFLTITPHERKFVKRQNGTFIQNNIALFPEELEQRISFFENELKYKIFNIMDPVNNRIILETIQDAFC